MQKKMETTIMGFIGYIMGFIGYIMGFIGYIMGLYGDNGKENGNYL